MTDSGFPIKPITGGAHPQAEASKPNVKLTALPSELQHVSKPVRIAGEVTEVKTDGSATIRTDQGDIEVQVRDARLQRVIAQGQQIEIQIPPGHPPREAQATVQQSQAIAQTPEQTPVTPRPTETPVDVVVIRPTSVEPGAQKPTQPVSDTPQSPLPQQPVRIEAVKIEEIIPYLKVAAIEEAVHLIATQMKTELPALPQTQAPIVTTETYKPVYNLDASPAPQTAPPTVIDFIEAALPGLKALSVPLYEGDAVTRIPLPIVLQETKTPSTFILPENVPLPSTPALQTFPQMKPVTVPTPNAEPVTITSIQTPALPLQAPMIQIPTGQTQPITENQILKPLIQFFEQMTPVMNNQKAGEHIAVMVGRTEQNLPVMITPGSDPKKPQAFILHTPLENIMPGTPLTFTVNETITPAIMNVNNLNIPAPIAVPLPTLSAIGFLQPQPWPLMTEILNTLNSVAPQLAQAMTGMTPSPSAPSQMAPAALFFLAAIRSGDISSWMGQKTIDALRRSGNTNLLSRLTQEGNTLSRLANEPVSQDWRAMSLPFYMDQEMHKVTLYYKKDDGARQDKEGKGGQTRFIFELNLSEMGPVQLDALYKPGRLDVILRTEDSFAPAMQQEMRDLYANTLRQTQVTGELLFQDNPQQWVKITPDNKAAGVRV